MSLLKRQGKSVDTALRFNVYLRLGMRGGLKPFAQARYTHAWVWPPGTSADFCERVFWAPKDRLGSTTVLWLEHAVSPALSRRWLAAATITQAAPKFAMSTAVGACPSFSAQRLLTCERLDGTQGAAVGLSEYGTAGQMAAAGVP